MATEAVLWPSVVLPFYREVEQSSAEAEPFIDPCSQSSQVKAREGKGSWEESPGVGSPVGILITDCWVKE